jgi:lysophospholipase L1-like esterase
MAVESTQLSFIARTWTPSWLTVVVASLVACASNSGSAGGSGSGGKNNGGSIAAGGSAAGGNMTGGQSSGSSGSGSTASQGGSTGSGGSATATGGASASGGNPASGGNAAGGAPAAGGQGTGGKASGGAIGPGGAANGGSTSAATGGQTTGGTSATGGASGTGGTSGSYHPCPTDGTACKIMPFGDSITDGYNQDTPGGYRIELFKRAHMDGKNITFVGSLSNGPGTVDSVSFPTHHEGHSGWTIYPGGGRDGISYCLSANDLKKCLATNSVMAEYKPDIVLLMIGTNDCIVQYDLANAPKRLGDLIDTIYTQLPSVLIVVAQPIPSRGDASQSDDTGLGARIKTYDDAIPAVVKTRADVGKHILLVDMYTPFNANKASLIEDQWHPNLAGYVVLGDQWYSVLKPLL